MIVADVMDELGDALDTIDGLRVFRYPPENVQAPAAVVAYPESIEYDVTYGRGVDTLTIPVIIVVGKVSDRASAKQLAAYMDGSGALSVKAVIEGATYTAFDIVQVTSADTDVYTFAGVDYVSAIFNLRISGPGA
ncbi:MAG: hypothetical protein R2761_23595 [Acidimicrobiales bacterium]